MWLERTFYPYAVILQTVPLVAIAPIIGLQMGYSNTSRIVICVVISLFPIIANTLFGLKSATLAAARPLRCTARSGWTRLRKLQFPAALPSIFTGLRISAGLSVIGAIVGEFFFRAGRPAAGGARPAAQRVPEPAAHPPRDHGAVLLVPARHRRCSPLHARSARRSPGLESSRPSGAPCRTQPSAWGST